MPLPSVQVSRPERGDAPFPVASASTRPTAFPLGSASPLPLADPGGAGPGVFPLRSRRAAPNSNPIAIVT